MRLFFPYSFWFVDYKNVACNPIDCSFSLIDRDFFLSSPRVSTSKNNLPRFSRLFPINASAAHFTVVWTCQMINQHFIDAWQKNITPWQILAHNISIIISSSYFIITVCCVCRRIDAMRSLNTHANEREPFFRMNLSLSTSFGARCLTACASAAAQMKFLAVETWNWLNYKLRLNRMQSMKNRISCRQPFRRLHCFHSLLL